jgi:glutamate mutase epsilon subunit
MAEDRASNSVRVVDPRVHRTGASSDNNSGDRIVPRDNNESGPMINENLVKLRRDLSDYSLEKINSRARAEGKTPVIKIDSNK